MTKILKPVPRETAVTVAGRPLIVELHPRYLSIRQKHQPARYAVTVDYGAIFDLGLKLAARIDTDTFKRRKP